MVRHKEALTLVEMSDSDFCEYGWKLARDDPATSVRFVRGRKMRTLAGVFDEFSAACQFPYYFGENYAALAECLGDLDWLNSSRFVLMISGFSELLAEEPVEMAALGRALATSIDEYNRSRQTSESAKSLFRVVVNGAAPHDVNQRSFFAAVATA
ncbi:barstar family protein [Bradyrhizobium manausense]|uniref:barstar family protein n=1 Tax=Bradyrhizobium manausense TaxID=989370 RepID=UPI001BA7D620|nr:barstar family protein [Bradyrhizobium manausense]MBR1086885.1 barstar family protein [Bradyrhizobium manausense]